MDYKEFRERVELGEEFQFYFQEESYWISQNADGYYLTRVKDGDSQSFTSANDLFEKGTIEGKTLFELWEQIEI